VLALIHLDGEISQTLTKLQDVAIYLETLMRLVPGRAGGFVRAEAPALGAVR
jgi:hypothetical protein